MRVRTEISKNKKYYINKHRYCELMHFCLQYPIWKQAYNSLDGLVRSGREIPISGGDTSDPTERCAEARYNFYKRMCIVEEAARETDAELRDYILHGVTEGLSYEQLRANYNIPCCKDVYYDLYRKFFYILNKKRG